MIFKLVNPSTPKSDWLLSYPYNITLELNAKPKVTRRKDKMPNFKSRLTVILTLRVITISDVERST